MEYHFDNWVIIKIKGDDPHYRVLAGASGGYLYGSSWKLNSGIVKIEEDGEYYLIYGSSGSCYKCHKESYMLRTNTADVWAKLQKIHGDKVELMPEETNWLEMDWILK